ncbi:MAG: hypothetical protein JW737_07320 [Acidobacteria bacterium]|nr:hypothetical protein [Acidobacteriota bacterium]
MKESTVIYLLIMALMLSGATLFASVNDDEKPASEMIEDETVIPFNLSLFYPISINKSKEDAVKYNLGILYSHIGYLEKFSLNGLVGAVEHDASGLMISGIANVVGGETSALQIAGLLNVSGGKVSGFQIAPINVTKDISGFQIGAMNLSSETSGFQIGLINCSGDMQGIKAGLLNCSGDMEGLLFGLMNLNGDFEGIMAGLANFTGGFTGMEFGLMNVNGSFTGIQVGLVNLSGRVEGIQIGLINVASHIEGVPIGLINLAENGRVRVLVWGSSLSAYNVGVKFMVNGFYSVISAGYNNLYGDIEESITWGARYGKHKQYDNLFIDYDLGYLYIDNKDYFSCDGNIDQHAIEIRFAGGIDLARKVSMFLGAGVNYIWQDDYSFGDGEVRLQIFGGFEFF